MIMTLNDLKRHNSLNFALFSQNSPYFQADYITVVEVVDFRLVPTSMTSNIIALFLLFSPNSIASHWLKIDL